MNGEFSIVTFDDDLVLNIEKPEQDVYAIHPDRSVSSVSPNWSCVSSNMLKRDQNDDCKILQVDLKASDIPIFRYSQQTP